jgi:hypothetical protein
MFDGRMTIKYDTLFATELSDVPFKKNDFSFGLQILVTTFVMWTFVYSTTSILTVPIKCRMICKMYVKDRQN